uniref:Uncharacterized protein n=1 Tax=Kuenenia stuttgartiensis TaxID=174633 RepID=Q1PYA4_KUEST|nr:unknown protein [Candidatus Kuenenia stuttgartiensis]
MVLLWLQVMKRDVNAKSADTCQRNQRMIANVYVTQRVMLKVNAKNADICQQNQKMIANVYVTQRRVINITSKDIHRPSAMQWLAVRLVCYRGVSSIG